MRGDGNWLHGHWSGKAGVAYYEGWLGHDDSTVTPVDNWVVLCCSGLGLNRYVNGVKINDGFTSQQSADRVIGINTVGHHNENSDWGAAFIVSWDRDLSHDELMKVSNFLMEGTRLEAECKCDNGVGTLECDELTTESDRAHKCASCNKGYHHAGDGNKCELSGMTRAKVKKMLHDHPAITLTDKEFGTFFNKLDSDKDGVVTQEQLVPELAKLIKDPEEEAKEASDKLRSNSIQKQFSTASQKAHVSGSVTNLRTNSR